MLPRKFFVNREELEEIYGRLQSLVKVAEELGVSKKLVLNYMKRFGIKRRDHRAPDRTALIKRYVCDGLTGPQIAELLGIDTALVYRIAAKNDIVIRDTYHVGFRTKASGYILIRMPNHPEATAQGYVNEHRVVMEEYLGRYLDQGEVVHHIDGKKSNNAIENLELMRLEDHVRLHHKGKKGRGPGKKNKLTQGLKI